MVLFILAMMALFGVATALVYRHETARREAEFAEEQLFEKQFAAAMLYENHESQARRIERPVEEPDRVIELR